MKWYLVAGPFRQEKLRFARKSGTCVSGGHQEDRTLSVSLRPPFLLPACSSAKRCEIDYSTLLERMRGRRTGLPARRESRWNSSRPSYLRSDFRKLGSGSLASAWKYAPSQQESNNRGAFLFLYPAAFHAVICIPWLLYANILASTWSCIVLWKSRKICLKFK